MVEEIKKLVRVVPVRFFDDHFSRDLVPDGECDFISKSGGRYRLAMTPAAIAELKSDADYYATGFVGEDAAEIRGLISSAKATLVALKKQEQE